MHYGPMTEDVPAWIRNMPLEEQIRDVEQGANIVEAATHEIGEWQVAKGRGPLTLHTMMQGGPINLGWTKPNCFAPISGADDAPTPLKVPDNV
jgi:hypothetical protein